MGRAGEERARIIGQAAGEGKAPALPALDRRRRSEGVDGEDRAARIAGLLAIALHGGGEREARGDVAGAAGGRAELVVAVAAHVARREAARLARAVARRHDD